MPDWFIVNVADAPALAHRQGGTYVPFESRDARFPDYGINIHVIRPGEPNARYHAEDAQEDFLVLAGECIAIVEGVERRLRAWDLLHCPAGTEHVLVGAGDGPCAVLMVGSRARDGWVRYPRNELAARHGASSAVDTDDPAVAYADWDDEMQETRLDWPPA